MRIRAYTLDVHAGHAPCWMPDNSQGCELLTLANCKPLIRNVAPVGEWIAGITPARMGHRLAYLMCVAEPITRMQYWERYGETRLDSIYRPKTTGGWHQLKNPWHSGKESSARDLSSDCVLLSTQFYVFANSYSDRDNQPRGLLLPDDYSELARGGMRDYGHFITVPESFLAWATEQPRLKYADFEVLREFDDDGCGCCKEEAV